ncbi:MAG: hypothetical protein J07AB43_09080 [Candidatus Nanosalina sp. J07AB43]|nr:MAG: hypothetical protein J07AB43_09080 [Candidatus Nanosalina sp. J07AB43]
MKDMRKILQTCLGTLLILPDELYSGYDWIVSISNSDLRLI